MKLYGRQYFHHKLCQVWLNHVKWFTGRSWKSCFPKFSMQRFTFAGGHFEFPIASKYHLLLRSFIATYMPKRIQIKLVRVASLTPTVISPTLIAPTVITPTLINTPTMHPGLYHHIISYLIATPNNYRIIARSGYWKCIYPDFCLQRSSQHMLLKCCLTRWKSNQAGIYMWPV
jgi:hypothetical protein